MLGVLCLLQILSFLQTNQLQNQLEEMQTQLERVTGDGGKQ